jgi:hypothetical protein
VIPYQGHGEAGPAVEGAAHVELRQVLANPEASQLATAVVLTAWVLALMRIWYAVLALTP